MLDLQLLDRLIDLWLAEDIGHGDLTSLSMIDADADAAFVMNARQPIALAGIDVAAACFRRYDPTVCIELAAKDGDRLPAKSALMQLKGKARSLLTVERTALNIVQHLSGIATETARWMDAIKGTKAKLIDTRKTTPGLRALEKHAVVCGGGAAEDHARGRFRGRCLEHHGHCDRRNNQAGGPGLRLHLRAGSGRR